jgi:hypothetical protein
MSSTPYPDISHILSAKAQRRLALAALSWEEKMVIVEQMRASLPRGMWHQARATLAGDIASQTPPSPAPDRR